MEKLKEALLFPPFIGNWTYIDELFQDPPLRFDSLQHFGNFENITRHLHIGSLLDLFEPPDDEYTVQFCLKVCILIMFCCSVTIQFCFALAGKWRRLQWMHTTRRATISLLFPSELPTLLSIARCTFVCCCCCHSLSTPYEYLRTLLLGRSYCKAVLLTAWPSGQFAPIPLAPLELFERPSIVALRDLSSIYIYLYISNIKSFSMYEYSNTISDYEYYATY